MVGFVGDNQDRRTWMRNARLPVSYHRIGATKLTANVANNNFAPEMAMAA